MNAKLYSLIIILLTTNLTYGQSKTFVSYPSLSPDAKTAYFSYDSDIWKVDLSSNQCAKITSMQGNESRARVSPDGKWLAFSSTQFNNADIYVVPTKGGSIKQLTFSDGADLMEAWSWDSKTIYFSNNTYNRGTTHSIDLQGGTPKRLFYNYFNSIHNIAPAPNGEFYFNDTWESSNQAYRKGYKGSYNPEIQSYNFNTGKHTFYTKYDGKDMWASIDKNGKVYFVSDEYTGQYNLFTFSNDTKIQLSTFKTSIKNPVVSANGEKVVFVKDYELWIYDVKSNTSKRIELNMNANPLLDVNQSYDVSGQITAMDVTPDDLKMAFISRGKLFVSDVKGKFVNEIPSDAKERILEIKWINNDSLVITQTLSGYPNLYLVSLGTKTKISQLTSDMKSAQSLVLNKERTSLAYISGRDELKILDTKTMLTKSLLKDEFWAIESDVPSFSPDGKFIMYCAYRNFEKDIFICELANNKITNLTNTGITETDAIWSPDGECIYFTSNRMNPLYPFGLRYGHIYKLPLTKSAKDFKSDKYEALWVTEKKSEKDSLNKIKVQIDPDKIMERITMVSPEAGSQNGSFITKKDDKTTLFYISDHDEGKAALWKTEMEPFEKPKTTKIADMSGYDIVDNGKKLYILNDGKIGTLVGEKIEYLVITHNFSKNNQDEFEQMFEETWAGVEENFYNETFHGRDWKKLKSIYKPYLANITSRADYREMMQDMLGELNSSHTGFSSNGKEEVVFYNLKTAHVGIMWDNENPFTVKSIIPRSPADITNAVIKSGDILLKVNDEDIDAKKNRDIYFTLANNQEEIKLTFKRGNNIIEQKYKTITTSELTSLLYEMWIDDNQKRVDDLSKNEIAYVHMRNMSSTEYDKFVIDMTQDFYKKKALILDLRYNTGGNVHDKVLNFLAQKPYLKWKYREGAFTNQPNFGPAGSPIILLTNEQSLSDAEMTTEGFKALGLGKVIGVETYRWIIFTSSKELVDGSLYRLPSWGCYSLDGSRNLEQTGVSPDIVVKQTFTDRLKGDDPQILRAVEEIRKMWK
jgi:tricorn protease